ncbi:MAG: hypothetical protein H3Z53_01475 [archaeon]|nr:hypothetical protein [archaeon]MCP8313030.1 hypothetical protein [archaeon]MCP8317440.1 hypothetical protein [archaeon]MCP8320008.1 hypothetical protein [archaeon]
MLDILDWLVTNSPMLVLVGVTIWYAYSTHRLVKQPINLLAIQEIYAPLNTIVISVQEKNINVYAEANLKPVRDIKEKIFYQLVDKSVKKAIEEWQGLAEEYNKIRASLQEEVQRVVNEEIVKRIEVIGVDQPEVFRSKVSNRFHEFWQGYYFSILIQGQVEDEKYPFVLNLKGSNDNNEIIFATGFPKAVFDKIDKAQISNLHKTVRDIKIPFSSLMKMLGKEIGKVK